VVDDKFILGKTSHLVLVHEEASAAIEGSRATRFSECLDAEFGEHLILILICMVLI
jgi:hypothetical protein